MARKLLLLGAFTRDSGTLELHDGPTATAAWFARPRASIGIPPTASSPPSPASIPKVAGDAKHVDRVALHFFIEGDIANFGRICSRATGRPIGRKVEKNPVHVLRIVPSPRNGTMREA